MNDEPSTFSEDSNASPSLAHPSMWRQAVRDLQATTGPSQIGVGLQRPWTGDPRIELLVNNSRVILSQDKTDELVMAIEDNLLQRPGHRQYHNAYGEGATQPLSVTAITYDDSRYIHLRLGGQQVLLTYGQTLDVIRHLRECLRDAGRIPSHRLRTFSATVHDTRPVIAN